MRTLLHHGILTIIVVAVAGCNPSVESEGNTEKEDISVHETPKTIVRVTLYSFPSGEGSRYHALRQVSPDGRVEGGHISGSPDAPIVHHETKQIGEDEVKRIWQQAEALASVWCNEWSVDRKEKHVAIVIHYSDSSQLRVAWTFSSKPRTDEAQSLYKTLSVLRVGAW